MVQQKLSLRLGLDSRTFERGLNRSGQAVDRFTRKSTRAFRSMGRTAVKISDTVVNKFSAGFGAIAVAALTKNFIDFEAQLVRFADQADLTVKEQIKMEKQIRDLSTQYGISSEEVLSGLDRMISKTGDIDLVRKSMEGVARASAATGTNMMDMGSVAATLGQNFQLTGDEMDRAFDILFAQGKAGAFELKNLASELDVISASASAMSNVGEQGLRSVGALLQIFIQGAATASETTTAFSSVVSNIISKTEKIRKLGVNVFDPEIERKTGEKVLRDTESVLRDIIEATQGDAIQIQKIFTESSIKAVNALIRNWEQAGKSFDFLDELKQVGGDNTEIMRALSRWTGTTAFQMNKLRNEIEKIAASSLQKPIELFTRALTKLNQHPVVVKGGIWALLGLGGTAVAVKGISKLIELSTSLTKLGRVSRGPGGLGRGMSGGIQKVFVVNQPIGAGATAVPGLTGAKAANRSLSSLAVTASRYGIVIGGLALATAGAIRGMEILKEESEKRFKTRVMERKQLSLLTASQVTNMRGIEAQELGAPAGLRDSKTLPAEFQNLVGIQAANKERTEQLKIQNQKLSNIEGVLRENKIPINLNVNVPERGPVTTTTAGPVEVKTRRGELR